MTDNISEFCSRLASEKRIHYQIGGKRRFITEKDGAGFQKAVNAFFYGDSRIRTDECIDKKVRRNFILWQDNASEFV
jgi:hypothetical protein